MHTHRTVQAMLVLVTLVLLRRSWRPAGPGYAGPSNGDRATVRYAGPRTAIRPMVVVWPTVIRATTLQPTSVQPPCAPMATTDITHTRARLTATMVLAISQAASLLVPGRGSAAFVEAQALLAARASVLVSVPSRGGADLGSSDADRSAVVSAVATTSAAATASRVAAAFTAEEVPAVAVASTVAAAPAAVALVAAALAAADAGRFCR